MMIGSCDSADLAAQAKAVFTREHHVEDQKVDAMVGHGADHFASVVRRRHVAGVRPQIFRNQRPRLAVVFNNKNVRRRHGDLCLMIREKR
jgi:hypothetical protein